MRVAGDEVIDALGIEIELGVIQLAEQPCGLGAPIRGVAFGLRPETGSEEVPQEGSRGQEGSCNAKAADSGQEGWEWKAWAKVPDWTSQESGGTPLDVQRSVCYWDPVTITYRFLIPRKAELRSFRVNYYGETPTFLTTYTSTCQVQYPPWANVARVWVPSKGRYMRRVSVHFQHRGLGNYPWWCNISSVVIRYRVPS